MKTKWIISCLLMAMGVYAQQDTTLNRVVTVERDFQPVIQSAGKINQRPTILQHDWQLNPVIYSTYSAPLSVGHNISLLQASETKFTPQMPLNGILEGGLGYRNTHFLFDYQIHQKKKHSLNVYANHDAYWGHDAQAHSKIGVDYTRHFSGLDFYANVAGEMAWWDYAVLTEDDSTVYIDNSILWNVAANIGVKSTAKQPIQYRIQTGYIALGQMYYLDHIVKSHLDFKWTNNTHAAGFNAMVKNNFYYESVYIPSDEPFCCFEYVLRNRHALRVEPFYEYTYRNFRLHAGVNLDMNIDPFMGEDKQLSTLNNLGFAPSPNVQMAWHTQDNIFHVYANVLGSYGTAMRDEELLYNRYDFNWRETEYIAPYTPVDATLGLKLRPAKSLLIDLYGGYAYLGQYATYVDIYHAPYTPAISIEYLISQQSYQQWKVGGALHYHYRDIVELNINGNYYFWNKDKVYDRTNWDLKARLDIHIDSKWSIYSDNYFAGSRWANTTDGDKLIRPIISLNIGGQYAINRWLSVYLQVNDYLNRKDEIFYGYKSQGIHFLLGVKWKF